jgi:DNA repair protein RecO (recombination protein O)
MFCQTRGIVLRSVKYGDTSLITTIFTEEHGILGFMQKGIRSARGNKASLFQSATLLELTYLKNPGNKLQILREYHLHEGMVGCDDHIIKRCIALFSAELLLRMLPEKAPVPDLFHFSFEYFLRLWDIHNTAVANYPLLFVIHCSRLMGYIPHGHYSAHTCFLNIREGGFSHLPPEDAPYVSEEEAQILDTLLRIKSFEEAVPAMSSTIRSHLLDWYLAFLRNYSQHLGDLRSLDVLQQILH